VGGKRKAFGVVVGNPKERDLLENLVFATLENNIKMDLKEIG
jgi:hypothetical protein